MCERSLSRRSNSFTPGKTNPGRCGNSCASSSRYWSRKRAVFVSLGSILCLRKIWCTIPLSVRPATSIPSRSSVIPNWSCRTSRNAWRPAPAELIRVPSMSKRSSRLGMEVFRIEDFRLKSASGNLKSAICNPNSLIAVASRHRRLVTCTPVTRSLFGARRNAAGRATAHSFCGWKISTARAAGRSFGRRLAKICAGSVCSGTKDHFCKANAARFIWPRGRNYAIAGSSIPAIARGATC